MKATYMPPMQTDDDLVDFCEMGPELSRESRGLRVWLPFKLHGARAFRDALDEKLDLAHYAADAIRGMPHIEMIAEPELSLLAFRYKPASITSEAELEATNKLLLAAVNDEQRVFLTAATVRGRFFIRICVLSFRTHRDRIDACLEDLRAGIASLGQGLVGGVEEGTSY